MKKAMFAGAITGIGLFMAAVAGAQKPELSWPVCGIIAGVALAAVGISTLYRSLGDNS